MDFQNRQYDPQIGRFLSVDPLADDGQEEWSPYAAMGNNPAMMVDPLGLKANMETPASEYVVKEMMSTGGRKDNTPGANEMNGEWLAGDIEREMEMREGRERDQILAESNNIAFWSGVLVSFSLSSGNFTLSNIGNGKFASNDFRIASSSSAGSGLLAGGETMGIGVGMAMWAEVAAAGTVAVPGLVIGTAGIATIGSSVFFAGKFLESNAAGAEWIGPAGTEYSSAQRMLKKIDDMHREIALQMAKKGKQNLWDDVLSPLTADALAELKKKAITDNDKQLKKRIDKEEKRRGDRNVQKRKK